MRLVLSIVMLCLGASASHAQTASPPVEDWAVYENARFGYRLVYPDSWFEAGPESANGDGRAFTTPDGSARIVTFASHNTEGMSLREYRTTLLEDVGGYRELTYSPVGKTWFVLSGYRGDRIYYEKVMFSCGGRIINVLSISFPESEKPAYSPVIEKIEDRFGPGNGYDTPSGC